MCLFIFCTPQHRVQPQHHLNHVLIYFLHTTASSANASKEELLSAIKFGLSEAADDAKDFTLSDADLDVLLARDDADEEGDKKTLKKEKKPLRRADTRIERLTEEVCAALRKCNKQNTT